MRAASPRPGTHSGARLRKNRSPSREKTNPYERSGTRHRDCDVVAGRTETQLKSQTTSTVTLDRHPDLITDSSQPVSAAFGSQMKAGAASLADDNFLPVRRRLDRGSLGNTERIIPEIDKCGALYDGRRRSQPARPPPR